MVNRFIRSKATGIVITGAVIAGLAVLADRFDLGSRIKQAAFATGQAGGDVITQPIAGLTNTLTSGINNIRLEAQKLFEGLATAGADVQEGFTGNRDAIGDFFGFGNNNGEQAPALEGFADQTPSVRTTPLRISDILNPQSGQRLFSPGGTQRRRTDTGGGTAFGGFSTFKAQEEALEKAFAESKARFPQFFSASTL